MGILRKGKKEIRILEEIELRNIETYEFKKTKINKNDEIKNNYVLDKDIVKLKDVLIKEIYNLAYSKLNDKINNKINKYLGNEIIIKYKIDKNEKKNDKIRLFGHEFFKRNKCNCKLTINNEMKELMEFLDISKDYKTRMMKLLL